MKKVIVLAIAVMISLFGFAQNSAPLNIIVQNPQKKALPNEVIIFEGKDSALKYRGTTNEKGEFILNLPAGEIYNITIDRIGEDEKYNTIEIPELEENQQFSKMLLIITITEPKVFTLNNVYFETGKHELLPKSFEALNELVEYLKLKEEVRIEIGGHTDNVGDNITNKKLSLARAKSVKEYLQSKGINTSRLETFGYGETQPIANNNFAEGRKLNRRTEIRIL